MEGSTLSPPTMSSLICRRPSPSHPLHLSPQHPLLPQCRLLGRSNASVVFVSLPSPKLLTHRLLPKHHSLPPDKPDSELDSAPQSSEFNKEIGGQGSAASRPSTVAFILAVLKSWLRGLPFWTQKKPPELNKHSPKSLVIHVDEGSHKIDSKGATEYIRIIIESALQKYLREEKSGNLNLPAMMDLYIEMQLKQQVRENKDDPFVTTGLSEKQIDPATSITSTWFTQELPSTTVAFVLMSPESLCIYVDEGSHRVYSEGVSEYFQLVFDNALRECLQEEKTRKHRFPALMDLHIKMELKQQACRNKDELFMNPEISEKQMDCRSTWFTQELQVCTLDFIIEGLLLEKLKCPFCIKQDLNLRRCILELVLSV